MSRLPFEFAHHMALLPIAWLAGLRVRGQHRDSAWWWLAGIFLVSWLADLAADLAPAVRGAVSVAYPLSQAALVGLVFLVRRDALLLASVLAIGALTAVVWRGVSSPDVFFRTIAWGAAAGIVVDRPIGPLRLALLATFGLCLVCWWGYVLRPGWASWTAYQSARALGIALFCWAAVRLGPTLRAA